MVKRMQLKELEKKRGERRWKYQKEKYQVMLIGI